MIRCAQTSSSFPLSIFTHNAPEIFTKGAPLIFGKAAPHALAFFWLDGFAVPALVVELVVEPVETLSRHSTVLRDPLRGTMSQTVETVEKVPFQKLFLKSGKELLKNACFSVIRTTFWQYFGCFLACCGRFF
jgi:hypothetical protein